jgi:hypothetical protein
MAHIIQLAFGVFMNSVGVIRRTKSREDHERNQQFGENQSILIASATTLVSI